MASLRTGAWEVVSALADLVVPVRCAGCDAAGTHLCPGCRADLDSRPQATRPRPCPPGLPPTWCVAEYAGAARGVVLAHKERGRLALAAPLGAALASAVVAAVPGDTPLVLVPVPSRRAATRARGHDPLLRIARCAAAALRDDGRPARVLPLLVAGRRLADQSGLTGRQRQVNLSGAHRLRHAASVPERTEVVVVDDVVTTGASLAEAARALRAGGIDVRAAAVVAATRRRSAR